MRRWLWLSVLICYGVALAYSLGADHVRLA